MKYSLYIGDAKQAEVVAQKIIASPSPKIKEIENRKQI